MTRTSCGIPSESMVCDVWANVSQSEREPMMTPTSGCIAAPETVFRTDRNSVTGEVYHPGPGLLIRSRSATKGRKSHKVVAIGTLAGYHHPTRCRGTSDGRASRRWHRKGVR